MSFISCSCSQRYLYFLVYWILEICRSLIQYILKDSLNLMKGDISNSFVNMACSTISDLLAGFLVLYTKFSNEDISIYVQKSEFENKADAKKRKPILLLFLISILNFASRLNSLLYVLIFGRSKALKRFQMDWLIGLDILFRYLFSYCTLINNFKKHHIVALIITIVGFIIMSFLDIKELFENDEEIEHNIFSCLITLPIVVLYPIQDIINKKLLSDNFLLPHSLMFARGVIESIFLIILGLILKLTNKIQFEFIDIDLIKVILIKIFLIIEQTAMIFSLLKIIFIFTPVYVSFLKISEAFSDTIYVLFLHISGDSLYKSNQYFYLILEILSIIIITFGTLMYNEMVYINKWDLNTNLRKELEIKEKLEREEDNITKYNSINEDD